MLFNKALAFSLAFVVYSSNLLACTGMVLSGKEDKVVSGRTVEFGSDLDMSVAVIPRNFDFTGDAPGGKGKKYTSKYASLGVYCFSQKKLMDGINEKGLVAAAFYFPGYAKYTEVTEGNRSKALSPVEFPNWVLSQFATIEEVKEALSSVIIAPTILENWGPSAPPLHYIIYDKKGKSIVIEPVNGALAVFEDPIGVLTNSPGFDWHLTNLNNYINLSPFNVAPTKIKGMELSELSQGSGMLGLPGDFTAPSRFVRASMFSSTALPSGDKVNQIFHLLNQFDIPKGAVIQKGKGGDAVDITWCTCVKDHQDLKYYYKTYDDQSVKVVDLTAF